MNTNDTQYEVPNSGNRVTVTFLSTY